MSMAFQAFTLNRCPWCKEDPSYMLLDPRKVKRWQGGEYVQNVWPEMDVDQRELLITGTHPACWNAMFPEEDEDEF